MKVLFIIYSFPPEVIAGWQQFTKELAEEFFKMGNHVTIIVTRSNLKSKIQCPGFKVIRIPHIRVPFVRYIFELYSTLLLSILEFPDIVFGMSLSPGGIISSFLGKVFKAKDFMYIIGR